MSIFIKAAISTPNQGLKNGKKAIELSMVANNRLILVTSKISKRTTETIKCSKTIRKVAWIRLVIELTSYCFCSVMISLRALEVLNVCVVKINMVKKVVAENIKLEICENRNVKFPKNILKIFVPVITKSPALGSLLPAIPV